ncbi:uncharacterized protein PSFLO_00813 [Pseudozyma flocculosa]|uniref:Uncharacterized protein n=1 Tax=Pseudozyma flocculosa TaxID=84751 RepID=A0A5C3ETH1_9BASI|nr:uncharacterized protein PSFLO_00813 [Pseudozyma flocculosa]
MHNCRQLGGAGRGGAVPVLGGSWQRGATSAAQAVGRGRSLSVEPAQRCGPCGLAAGNWQARLARQDAAFYHLACSYDYCLELEAAVMVIVTAHGEAG